MKFNMMVGRITVCACALAFASVAVRAQDDEYVDAMEASDYEFNFEPLPPQVPVEEI